MNRLAFIRRMALAAAACAFIDVPWPKRETAWQDRVAYMVARHPCPKCGGTGTLQRPYALMVPHPIPSDEIVTVPCGWCQPISCSVSHGRLPVAPGVDPVACTPGTIREAMAL